MLKQLFIQNIAVIHKANIELTEGLNIFTGETGSGKSILIGAINAVLGERTNKDIIRAGESKASISAVFTGISASALDFIRDCGFEVEGGDELLLSRDITASSTTCRINGMPATVAILKQIGERLVNIHGQHDNQLLFNADNHRKIIDEYSGIGELLEDYKGVYKQYKDICSQIENISIDERTKAHRLDLLTYQIKEIEAADLEVGEEDELNSRRTVIKNASKLAESLSKVLEYLGGDNEMSGAIELIEDASYNLSNAARFMERFEPMAGALQDFKYELEEVASSSRDALEELEYDPKELDNIESRLDTIHKLKKKYGSSVEDILSFYERAQSELDDITFADQKLEKLNSQREKLLLASTIAAEKLTAMRKESGDKLVKEIEAQLVDLDMKAVKLSISCSAKELSSNGADEIEFLISTNPGEQAKPLYKIASGGELSRIMLAIKTVTSENDDIDTLIFDEVDSGVSGRAAQKIGRKLKQVGKHHQVLCVTHLSQVAIYGDNHLLISKEVLDDRTYTDILPLSLDERVGEIARINSGDNITDLSLDTAREMLLLASKGL